MEKYLGRMVLFTITESSPVKRDDIVTWYQELGMSNLRLPPHLRAIDAFKKATAVDTIKALAWDTRESHLGVEEIISNSELVQRHIVREIPDPVGRQTKRDTIIECVFYRPRQGRDGHLELGSERIRFTILPEKLSDTERVMVNNVTNEMTSIYNRHQTYLDAQKLRAVVRDYLRHLDALEVKGGAYFVLEKRADETEALRTLVNRFGGGCTMFTVRVLDGPDERAMLQETFERGAITLFHDVRVVIQQLQNERARVTPSAYAKVRAQYDEAMRQADVYLELLGASQEVAADAAEATLTELIDLQALMLEGNAA